MILRKAQPTDRQQIISLWEKVFGDTKDVSARLLDYFAGPNNVYVAEENDDIVSQLLAVPCTVNDIKGTYLYALATVEQHRGKGIMKKLMNYTEDQVKSSGSSFFILIPASKSLFEYYEKHGFKNMYLSNVDLNSLNGHDEEFNNGQIPSNIFLTLRDKYVGEGVVNFTEGRTGLALEEQWYYGCKAIYNYDGYAIYLKVDDTLFVTEIGALNEEIAQHLIYNAKQQTGCEKIKVALPENSSLFSNIKSEEKQTPQAQYKWWGVGEVPQLYLRFALDDLPARIMWNKDDVIL